MTGLSPVYFYFLLLSELTLTFLLRVVCLDPVHFYYVAAVKFWLGPCLLGDEPDICPGLSKFKDRKKFHVVFTFHSFLDAFEII